MMKSALLILAPPLLAVGLVWGQTTTAPTDIARITSDTIAYCSQLAAQAEATPMTVDVRSLHDQGVQLCARGQLQAGIARLRRAVIMSRIATN